MTVPGNKRENAKSQRALEAVTRIEALIKAIQSGTLEDVQKCCVAFRDQSECSTARDVKGRGCLHLVAQRRDAAAVDICKHLVERVKCDVEMRDEEGATALLIAMSRANYLVLEYLLVEAKANAVVTICWRGDMAGSLSMRSPSSMVSSRKTVDPEKASAKFRYTLGSPVGVPWPIRTLKSPPLMVTV